MSKTVMIQADKARNLKFGINQMIELEEKGIDVARIEENNMSFKDLRTIFYVGLKWEDNSLTYEQTGDIIDIVGIEEISKAMEKAFKLAFGGSAAPSEL